MQWVISILVKLYERFVNFVKYDIMLNAKDLIGEIQERARERKLSTLKQNKPFSSAEPKTYQKQIITRKTIQLLQSNLKSINSIHQYMRIKN
ncbi:hypothetical protein BU583_02615 [Staphylococcus agnetis]|nr:hypothetical protein BU583_02615 [Staphylococcus agnetis]